MVTVPCISCSAMAWRSMAWAMALRTSASLNSARLRPVFRETSKCMNPLELMRWTS